MDTVVGPRSENGARSTREPRERNEPTYESKRRREREGKVLLASVLVIIGWTGLEEGKRGMKGKHRLGHGSRQLGSPSLVLFVLLSCPLQSDSILALVWANIFIFSRHFQYLQNR